MPLEAVGERGEPALMKSSHRRDAGGTGRTQFAARVSKAKAKIEARLDYVSSRDEQHRDAAVSRHDRVNPVRDHFEQPRRAARLFARAGCSRSDAIHRDVDQRRRPQPPGEPARDVRGVKVVDLGIEHRAGARLGATTVRCIRRRGESASITSSHDSEGDGMKFRRWHSDRRGAMRLEHKLRVKHERRNEIVSDVTQPAHSMIGFTVGSINSEATGQNPQMIPSVSVSGRSGNGSILDKCI